MYALPRPSSYIAKSKIVIPRPRTCSANNNMSSFSVPVFSAGDYSVSSGVQKHIAPEEYIVFCPGVFGEAVFCPDGVIARKTSGSVRQMRKGRARNLVAFQIRPVNNAVRFGILRSLGRPSGPARGGIATDTAAMAPSARLAPQKRPLLALSKTRTP